MIPSVTSPKIARPYIPLLKISVDNPAFERLTFSEKLQHIGLIDERFKVLFTLSEIPAPSEESGRRFVELMKREVHFCTKEGEIIMSSTHAEYISDWKKELLNRGFKTLNYLRGGYAAYVADLNHSLIFLIQEFLISKNLPKDLLDKDIETLKNLKENAPYDVDLFDYVINDGIPSTGFPPYYIDFLKIKTQNGDHTKIQLLQLLAPEKTTDLFPYPANYMLVTVGNPKEKLQTDRITGKLHHLYLFTRDDISIEIIDGQMCIPKSAGNFSQMLIDRIFKVVRTEPRHQLDFRAGLASLQLIHDDHILIEDDCTLQSILDYALKIDDERIYTGATDRAKLHCNNSKGFLLSVLAAYSNTATIPDKYLQILTKAIGEFPPLLSLYKYALLLTLYKDQTDRAEWDPSGFLILYWDQNRIVFPKNFALTSTEPPFFSTQIGSWIPSPIGPPIYEILDSELSYLERVLFELASLKPDTPLTESLKDALVDYLIHTDSPEERIALEKLLPLIVRNPSRNLEWVKTLFSYSFKHGQKLWDVSKTKMNDRDRHKAFEEIIFYLVKEKPNLSYTLVEAEALPKDLRLKLLKVIVQIETLSAQASKNITEEFYLWIEGIDDIEKAVLVFQDLKTVLQKQPESYIKYIKRFHLPTLAKEWIEAFPSSEKMPQAILFFTDYEPKDAPLIDIICELPGLSKPKLLDDLISKKVPILAGRAVANLLTLLNDSLSENLKNETLKMLAKMPLSEKEAGALAGWLQKSSNFALNTLSWLSEEKNTAFPKIALNVILFLKMKNKPLLWLEVLKSVGFSLELIPFYKDRGWVRSVYGIDAHDQTKMWARTLIKTGTLDKEDLATVKVIQSRTQLIHSPLVILRNFLQPLTKDTLDDKDKVSSLFHQIISLFLIAIQKEDEYQLHYCEIVYHLFKLAIETKLHTNNSFILMQQIYDSVPLLTFNGGSFDPLAHLIQTLPLVDYGSEKLYNEWNEKRNETYLKWMDRFKSEDDQYVKYGNELVENAPLKILPYTVLQASCKYAFQFKLITEQFIEKKVSKVEFQKDIEFLSQSAAQEFKSLDLLPHEDPCLICIQDLSHLLKKTNKREPAYDAFEFLLSKQPESAFYIKQKKYLEIRKETEELIISGLAQVAKRKIVGLQFSLSINSYMQLLAKSGLLPNIHIQDPVLDAMETESIPLMERMDLQRTWHSILKKFPHPYYLYRSEKIESYVAHELKNLNKIDAEIYLKNRILSLNAAKKLLDNDTMLGEVALITNSAHLHLVAEKTREVLNFLEKTVSIKVRDLT